MLISVAAEAGNKSIITITVSIKLLISQFIFDGI
jgi:hypothetical protein